MSLLTKQPATIAWIDSFSPNSVFWDVGANIGVYSLYAALRHGTRIVAFEPAAINYFLLAANVEANCLDSQVDCLLVGLGNERAVARLEVSQFMPARSFSFRGKKGQPYPSRQAALMVSMDQLIEDYGLECPNYIKIDVPGLKEDIVAGGERMLQRSDVREVHIECAAEGRGAQHIVAMLARAGLYRLQPEPERRQYGHDVYQAGLETLRRHRRPLSSSISSSCTRRLACVDVGPRVACSRCPPDR